MSEYFDIYLKRLNRYGLDYQSRVQGQREKEFENYLYKSIYRVDFEYQGQFMPGSLERDKQNHSEIQANLLTRRDCIIPSGTVLTLKEKDGDVGEWLVWWLEEVVTSGYNTYVVLKLTQSVSWFNEEDNSYITKVCLSGPGASAIKQTIMSSKSSTVYSENNNLYKIIMPYDKNVEKGVYLETTYLESTKAFVVTEVDITSTPGISYVTIDPTFVRNHAPAPNKKEEDSDEVFFWLNGGDN